eukprot:GDKK01058609.1.p1 GENE.GDKK01058609.1~~GDKK01058609.1.p1  ORF type:complete len:149 (-),score=33.29 GDKK01058609.1:102-548(-)
MGIPDGKRTYEELHDREIASDLNTLWKELDEIFNKSRTHQLEARSHIMEGLQNVLEGFVVDSAVGEARNEYNEKASENKASVKQIKRKSTLQADKQKKVLMQNSQDLKQNFKKDYSKASKESLSETKFRSVSIIEPRNSNKTSLIKLK